MKQQQLIPKLFRTEYSKITAVLCNRFGIDHIEIAEDLASDTFLAAMETWTYKGIPENSVAWLYSVAKNKAKNYFHRNTLFAEKIAVDIKHSSSAVQETDIDLSDKNISDS
ncbi:MAG: RNA polymerase subunit sigma, partial [Bacteroidota bacterium]|nr:RNA polymerase subunit sigma [Bacteroidota bacterium]